MVSLCHQYRARQAFKSMQSDQDVWPTSSLYLNIPKVKMDSAKNGRWIIPLKKFGRLRDNIEHWKDCIKKQMVTFHWSHENLQFQDRKTLLASTLMTYLLFVGNYTWTLMKIISIMQHRRNILHKQFGYWHFCIDPLKVHFILVFFCMEVFITNSLHRHIEMYKGIFGLCYL